MATCDSNVSGAYGPLTTQCSSEVEGALSQTEPGSIVGKRGYGVSDVASLRDGEIRSNTGSRVKGERGSSALVLLVDGLSSSNESVVFAASC